MKTVKLNYEIRQDSDNNRMIFVISADEFQSD